MSARGLLLPGQETAALGYPASSVHSLHRQYIPTTLGGRPRCFCQCQVPHQSCYRAGFLSRASYSLPSCKFGVHHHPFWASNTLGRIIASVSLSAYALRFRRSTGYLGINLFGGLYRFCSIFNAHSCAMAHVCLRCVFNICSDVY